jgi:F-type H+-transporting ATPase subunit b
LIVVYGWSVKFGWKPIIKGLTDRENSIRTDLDTAKAEREKAGALLGRLQAGDGQREKRGRGYACSQAQDQAEKCTASRSWKRSAKEQGQKLLEKARVDIERESDAAKAELVASRCRTHGESDVAFAGPRD